VAPGTETRRARARGRSCPDRRLSIESRGEKSGKRRQEQRNQSYFDLASMEGCQKQYNSYPALTSSHNDEPAPLMVAQGISCRVLASP